MIDATTRGQIVRFLLVGGCGFASDIVVFKLLFFFDGGLILSRLGSASVAVTVTWMMNRNYTFKTAGGIKPGLEYIRYVCVQSAGLVINLGTYFILVLRYGFFAERPLLALWAGGSLAIVANFLGSKLWAFRHARETR